MSADLLRRAATVLRLRAGRASGGDWTAVPEREGSHPDHVKATWRDGEDRRCARVVAECFSVDDALYFATMHPEVAEALAEWLETVDTYCDCGDECSLKRPAHAVARKILGESE